MYLAIKDAVEETDWAQILCIFPGNGLLKRAVHRAEIA